MSGYAHVRNGSKAEKLDASICFPFRIRNRTSLNAVHRASLNLAHVSPRPGTTPADPTRSTRIPACEGWRGGEMNSAGDALGPFCPLSRLCWLGPLGPKSVTTELM
jgi:hypothetical protein